MGGDDRAPIGFQRLQQVVLAPLPGRRAARRRAGGAAEDASRHQPGAARIVEIEQPADQLSRRGEAGDGQAVVIDDIAPGGDLEAAEGEGDAAGDGVGLERRLIDGLGPVGFRHVQANR